MLDLLRQYRMAGLDQADIERAFPEQGRSKLKKLLWNMRGAGDARSEKTETKAAQRWYYVDVEKQPAHTAALTDADKASLYRARRADREDPLRLYGAQLQGGRCASVWDYAQHVKEHRA